MLSESTSIALSTLLTSHTFFATLLYSQLQLSEADEVGMSVLGMVDTAATDGTRLVVNPTWFAELTNQNRVFVLAHEVLHTIWGHPWRGAQYHTRGVGPDGDKFDGDRWRAATDYIVNAALIEAKVGVMPTGDNKGLVWDKVTASMSAEEVYMMLPDEKKKHGFDQHITPANEVTAASEMSMQAAVFAAAAAAKARGQLPDSISKLVGDILSPTISWEEVLYREMVYGGRQREKSWSKPNRRRLATSNIVLPARAGSTCGVVVCVMDTSGSISVEEASAQLSNVKVICEEHLPEKIYLLWTDTKVAHVDELEDPSEIEDILARCTREGLPGGGGTDMPAAFKYMDEQGIHPTTCVVFTDGYTPFGDAQSYPVIWAITDKGQVDAPPFGVKLYCDVK